jgi:phospholipase/lecithinase/hemolysin
MKRNAWLLVQRVIRAQLNHYSVKVSSLRDSRHKHCVCTLFPNASSAPRLVNAVLIEISQGRETANAYNTMETDKLSQAGSEKFRMDVALSVVYSRAPNMTYFE